MTVGDMLSKTIGLLSEAASAGSFDLIPND